MVGVCCYFSISTNPTKNVFVTRTGGESIIKLAKNALMAANMFNEGDRVSWRSGTWKAYRSSLLDHVEQDISARYINEHAINYIADITSALRQPKLLKLDCLLKGLLSETTKKKHQRSALLVLFLRLTVVSSHKWPVMRKVVSCYDVTCDGLSA